MGQINVHVSKDSHDKFREIKFILKASTNEDAEEKIIDFTYKRLKEGEEY